MQPNCYAQLIDVGGCKHVVLTALRDILAGEELSYDYCLTTEACPDSLSSMIARTCQCTHSFKAPTHIRPPPLPTCRAFWQSTRRSPCEPVA